MSCGAFAFRLLAPRAQLHQRALANIAAAFPEAASAERNRIASAMWGNLGRVAVETLLIDRILNDPTRVEVLAGPDVRRRLLEPGPIIAVTLHMGNWELVPLAHAGCNGALAAVYRPFRNPYLDRFMRSQRVRLYPGGLVAKGRLGADKLAGHATGRGLIAAVREGGALGFVCDQVGPRGCDTVPFFGYQAKFNHAPGLVARHVGARIWAVRCLRVGRKARFRIEIKEIPLDHTANRQQDVHKATAAMAGLFEDWIRDAPEQWMWWQRRSIAET